MTTWLSRTLTIKPVLFPQYSKPRRKLKWNFLIYTRVHTRAPVVFRVLKHEPFPLFFMSNLRLCARLPQLFLLLKISSMCFLSSRCFGLSVEESLGKKSSPWSEEKLVYMLVTRSPGVKKTKFDSQSERGAGGGVELWERTGWGSVSMFECPVGTLTYYYKKN